MTEGVYVTQFTAAFTANPSAVFGLLSGSNGLASQLGFIAHLPTPDLQVLDCVWLC